MALIYFILFLVNYVLPLLLTAGLALLLYRLLRRRLRYAAPLSIGIALALSCAQPAYDWIMLRRDLARYAPDELRPETLQLAPGALLHLQEGNHRGVTCGPICAFSRLPFVTSSTTADLSLNSEDWPPDLWPLLPEADRSQPFPYRYAFISVSTFVYAKALGFDRDYRKPYWPLDAKAVHMLVEIPPDGMLDLASATAHYRRFNMQVDMAEFPFWGIAVETVVRPEVPTIFAELAAAAGAGAGAEPGAGAE